MRNLKSFIYLFGLGLSLLGCAGDDATLEEARYLLGRGGVENGANAATMVTSLMASSNPQIKYEAIRIYAGGKAAEAGFDSIQIIATMVHKDADDEFVDLLEAALTNIQTNSSNLLDEAENALLGVIGSAAAGDPTVMTTDQGGVSGTGVVAVASDFSSLSAEEQNEFVFQLGLIRYLQAARISLDSTGLLRASTFTAASCEAELNIDEANDGTINLETAKQNLLTSGLDTTNVMVDLISDFQGQVDPDRDGLAGTDGESDSASLTAFCNAIESQKSGS